MRSLTKLLTIIVAIPCLMASVAFAEDDLTRRASWSAPTTAEVKSQLDQWLDERELSDEQRQQIEALWKPAIESESATDPSANLTLLVESAQIAWPDVTEVVSLTKELHVKLPVPTFEVIAEAMPEEAEAEATDNSDNATDQGAEENGEPTDSEAETADPAPSAEEPVDAADEEQASSDEPVDLDRWMRGNLRLHYARWLAQQELYDESLELIATLKPTEVVDPASLLFYQSAAYHFLLNKTEGLATIETLLENEETIARRYALTAKLMAADLTPLKTDSLDEVARLMDDIERRLRLQRAGKRVRKEEDDVVAKLDKMIEELEKQQQQQQGGGLPGSSNSPSQPMQDSQIGGASGEGNVDPKRLAAKESWGNLPPKERQEALQQITKELPAHYREAVEEYFRKLARDGVNP